MASLLSNLDNNVAEGIHKLKCKYGHYNKKCETYGIKYKDCECCLKYTNLKNNVIEYKWLCCNKNYQKTFDENLRKRFPNLLNKKLRKKTKKILKKTFSS